MFFYQQFFFYNNRKIKLFAIIRKINKWLLHSHISVTKIFIYLRYVLSKLIKILFLYNFVNMQSMIIRRIYMKLVFNEYITLKGWNQSLKFFFLILLKTILQIETKLLDFVIFRFCNLVKNISWQNCILNVLKILRILFLRERF